MKTTKRMVLAMSKTLAFEVGANPVTDAKTATGRGFHSDGRILVLVLKRADALGVSR